MRILLLLGALVTVLAVSREWDRLHPLRATVGSRDGSQRPSGAEPYLDLRLLERRRRAAAPPGRQPAPTTAERRTA